MFSYGLNYNPFVFEGGQELRRMETPKRKLIERMLRESATVAVVGISAKADRPSYGVAEYLSRFYRIIPINPVLEEWEGMPAYPSLTEAAKDVSIDLVDVFRRAALVMPVIEDAIAARAKFIWLQLGIVSAEAARRCTEAGVPFVMDACTAVEHGRMLSRQGARQNGD